MPTKKLIAKISDMRNLGPMVEADLAAVGITKPAQIRKLGAEKVFLKMLDGRIRLGRSAKCCNALYLYALYGAIHDIDWRALPEARKEQFKAFTDKVRRSGIYG